MKHTPEVIKVCPHCGKPLVKSEWDDTKDFYRCMDWNCPRYMNKIGQTIKVRD